MKNIKIAFIGTHGTGKTTLVHELIYKLKEKGIHVDYCEEVSRRCPLKINEDAKSQTQRWIISKQIMEETEKREKCSILICDRSILDTYSYECTLLGRKKLWETFIEDYLKTYDLLIKVPIKEKFLKSDGVRSTDKQFQKKVDKQIDKNLKKFKQKYIKFKGKETMDYLIEKLSEMNFS